MSFSFLSPLFLWGLLAIPLVILLHFIRTRKKPQTVSALFLWKKALELSETRRRFSPSWLLLLQVLFVTLATLALSQPNLSFQGPPDRIFIMDASASMTTQDSDGVRLDKAVQEATNLARNSGRVAIIRAGLDATVVQGITGNTSELTTALNRLVAADHDANMDRAVSLALSVAAEADIHIFSDAEMPTGAQITPHPISGDALNVGINTFDVGIQQAFVSVVTNHPRPQEIVLELWQVSSNGETPVGQTTLLVPAMGQANVTFPLQSSSGFFEARIGAPSWDALNLDNNAFAGKRNLNVVLNAQNDLLERAIAAIPNVQFQTLPNADLSAPGFDVKVIFGALPEGATGNYVQFSQAHNVPVYKIIRSWDRSDPLLRFVDLTEGVIGLGLDNASFDEPWEILAETADLSPAIARLNTADLNVISLNFHPSQTDMVNRSAFPLLMTNIMNDFRDSEKIILGEQLPSNSTLLQGETQSVKERADSPGIYTINGEPFTASLLSANESRLTALDAAVSETTFTNDEERSSERVRNLAIWLIGIATVALMLEWVLWSRSQGAGAWAFRR